MQELKVLKDTAPKHPLEDRPSEAEYFARQNKSGAAAYRRAVTATTGTLPTWAKRKPAGRPRRKPEPVRCGFDQ